MPTDPLSPVYSGVNGDMTINAPTQLSVIQGVHDLLVSVGWSSTGLYAVALVSFPLGAPTVVAQSPLIPPLTVCCGDYFLTIGSQGFVGYNPYTEQPCSDATCAFFAWGLTALDTLTNLAAAITGAEYIAVVNTVPLPAVDQYTLVITAASPGPLPNLVNVIANGAWGIGEPFGGGGYQLQSTTTTLAGYSCSQYGFQLTSGPFSTVPGGQPLNFAFIINGNMNAAEAQLDCSPDQYILVANGSIFAIFNSNPDGSFGANTNLLCCAPWIPANFENVYAVCLAWGGEPGYWRSNMAMNQQFVCTALAGNANTYSNAGGYPRILAFFNPSNPLNTPAGIPIAIGAYVMMGASYTDTAYIVGIMADCSVLQAAIGDGAMIGGHRTRSLIVDTSVTPVTLTMAVDG